MSQPLIFLDIDGVLNSTRWCAAHPLRGLLPPQSAQQALDEQRLDPDCVGRLEQLVRRLDARIVISSTWRLRLANTEILELFKLHGFSNAPLIGATPQLPQSYQSGRCVARGTEVAAWRAENAEEATDYLCVDDGADYLASQPLLLTDPEVGLSVADVEIGIRLVLKVRT